MSNISPNMLEIRGLSINSGNKRLLHDVNLVIPSGEIHALLGPNGSGKTTLMMAIMGFSEYQVTAGRIIFNNENITNMDINERAEKGIAIALQRPPSINGLTLRKILEYILKDDPEKEGRIIDLARIAKLDQFLDRSVNKGLSGGEIKRAELLQLLALNPAFAMIDEPDSGVDIEAMTTVGNLIEHIFQPDSLHPALRKSGLIITHNCNVLKYFNVDKAHIMYEGRIGCSGNPNLVIKTINEHGYDECIRCIGEKEDS